MLSDPQADLISKNIAMITGNLVLLALTAFVVLLAADVASAPASPRSADELE